MLGMFGLSFLTTHKTIERQYKRADMIIWFWKLNLILTSTAELEKQSVISANGRSLSSALHCSQH